MNPDLYKAAVHELNRQVDRMNAANALMTFTNNRADEVGLSIARKEFSEASYLVMMYNFMIEDHKKDRIVE